MSKTISSTLDLREKCRSRGTTEYTKSLPRLFGGERVSHGQFPPPKARF